MKSQKNQIIKTSKTVLASIALMFSMSTTAVAIPMDINFTVGGSATGSGVLVADSNMLLPNAFECCSDLDGLTSLDITMNFGLGNTSFGLGDLNSL